MLTIVATIKANPGKEAFVQAALEKLLPVTRKEAGCVQYDMHRNNDDPSHFLFFELWTTRELWQAHINAPHLVEFREATEGALAELTILEMTQVA